MTQEPPNLYSEAPDAGNAFREEQLAQVRGLIRRERRNARLRRQRFFRPDCSSPGAYAESLVPLREQYLAMLGWPLTQSRPTAVPDVEETPVAEDALGRIVRMKIDTLPGVQTYGVLFLPHGTGPFPLVISQHGGGGTPELCSGFFGSANYNDMTRRVLRRGFAVFAPQLLLWRDDFGPVHHRRDRVDQDLKQLGGSITALEVFRIQRSLDYLLTRHDVDSTRVGMIGLSYGGFYTLYTAAAEPRIDVAVSSCFFNNRLIYNASDWVWTDSASRFLDAEVAALVCPRALYLEVGKKDNLFAVGRARSEARRAQAWFERVGVGERFVYREHEGGHELDRSDDGIGFLCTHINRESSG